MNKAELKKIIAAHKHWIKQDCAGWEDMKADLHKANLCRYNLQDADLRSADLSGAILAGTNLTGTNLSGAGLREADLSGANLRGANLDGANLREANLSGANLHGACLTCTDLSGADLSGADLSCTDLSGADLSCTDLRSSNLYWADLSGADLELAEIYTATLDSKADFRKGVVLKKAIKGYKKTAEGVVITAAIPAGAVVYSINGTKCRTNMATITDTAGHKLLHSMHDSAFTYKPGKKILVADFDTRYNVECGKGFHFFRTKKAAEDY